jgi:hypothetical protein
LPGIPAEEGVEAGRVLLDEEGNLGVLERHPSPHLREQVACGGSGNP